MGKRTGVIRYNLNETGRTFTGQSRKIDIDAAIRVVNGPLVQEAVAKGDVQGYIGHQYREKFGLQVPETVIVDGKQVVLEPCVKTIYIKVYPNGDLEHEQEFLDTAAGRVGERLWESKAYGFSSAFYAPDEGGLRTIKAYFGMDLVRGPNYDKNRGQAVMLDSVDAGGFTDAQTFAVESAELLDSVDRYVKGVESEATRIAEDYLAQCRMNDDLVDQNARLLERLSKLGQPGAMLDNATLPEKMERGAPMDKGQAMLDSAHRFMSQKSLPGYEPSPEEREKEKAQGAGVVAGVKNALSVIGSVFSGG